MEQKQEKDTPWFSQFLTGKKLKNRQELRLGNEPDSFEMDILVSHEETSDEENSTLKEVGKTDKNTTITSAPTTTVKEPLVEKNTEPTKVKNFSAKPPTPQGFFGIYLGGGEKNGKHNFVHVVFDTEETAQNFSSSLVKNEIIAPNKYNNNAGPTVREALSQYHPYPKNSDGSAKYFLRIHKNGYISLRNYFEGVIPIEKNFEHTTPHSDSLRLSIFASANLSQRHSIQPKDKPTTQPTLTKK